MAVRSKQILTDNKLHILAVFVQTIRVAPEIALIPIFIEYITLGVAA